MYDFFDSLFFFISMSIINHFLDISGDIEQFMNKKKRNENLYDACIMHAVSGNRIH